MIQGVHAETVAFVDYKQAAQVLEPRSWSWLGEPAEFSARRLRLEATPARDCRLRVTRVQVLKHALVCTLHLESFEAPPGTAFIRGDLTVTASSDGNAASRCVLSFQGLASRNLATSSGPASADRSLRLANEYARSFLSQVAGALEREGAALSIG